MRDGQPVIRSKAIRNRKRLTPDPVNIEDFAWNDLDAGGVTDLGKAFELLAAQLTIPP